MLKTDGLGVDPVSGNEIPAGSNAEEVRDDIDAKLSDGEYVVPADVVRFFGVSFFEKLRSKAKKGIEEMDADGRIGGEPVEEDTPNPTGLSPEEMAELNEVLGLAEGGLVQGFDEGGLVEDQDALKKQITQMGMANTNWGQYATPGSFTRAQATQAATPTAQTPAAPAGFEEYVGPNGQIMMIPVDANGNPIMPVPEGFTLKAEAETPQETREDDGRDLQSKFSNQREAAEQRNREFFDNLHTAEDPAALAATLLGETPLGLGGIVGAADTLSDIARIRGYAKAIESSHPELAASLNDSVEKAIKDGGLGVKGLEGIIAKGDMYADKYSNYLGATKPAVTAPTTGVASTGPTPLPPKSQHAKDDGSSKTHSEIMKEHDAMREARKSSAIKALETSGSSGQAVIDKAKSYGRDTTQMEKENNRVQESLKNISKGGTGGFNKGGLVNPKKPTKPQTKKGKRGLGRK